MIDNAIQEKYFQAKFVSKSLDFHFYAPPSAHNWNPYFELFGETYSKDNNSLDFGQKIQKLGSNSSSECLHSKTFKLRPESPYPLKVIVETVTEGHFSTHFLSDYSS